MAWSDISMACISQHTTMLIAQRRHCPVGGKLSTTIILLPFLASRRPPLHKKEDHPASPPATRSPYQHESWDPEMSVTYVSDVQGNGRSLS